MKVEELLQEKKIPYKQSPRDFVVKCLNPEHDDNNPSMRIDRVTGIYNCFSCGFKGNIFKFFDAPSNPLDIKREKFKRKIQEKRSDSIGLLFPSDTIMYIGSHRNISEETFKHFECFLSGHSHFEGRYCFPIRDIRGKIVAFNNRAQSPTQIPKYLFEPPGAVLPLYPSKVSPIKGRVILVEGIYDAINLYDKGLRNAVCCFGTRNINEEKLTLLKMQGVTQVDIFFDPDDAGLDAQNRVIELCEKVGLLYYGIKIRKELGDAGALTHENIKKLKERLYG